MNAIRDSNIHMFYDNMIKTRFEKVTELKGSNYRVSILVAYCLFSPVSMCQVLYDFHAFILCATCPSLPLLRLTVVTKCWAESWLSRLTWL